jgi:dihydroflavonol-4-reductase
MATVLVTGATGLTGSNVCLQLLERGDTARALVRRPEDAAALDESGVELVAGDVTDRRSVVDAAAGCEAVVHAAALLGGATQDRAEFDAVNLGGTVNVLDAAELHGLRRVVAFSTGTFFDRTTGVDLEDAPLLEDPPDDPYTASKLAAYLEVHRRAEGGHDVLTCHPGAIYGPGPVVDRALARTSFNRVFQAALRGRIRRQLTNLVSWVTGADVARGALAALDHGTPGASYWLVGRSEDRVSTAEACNRAIALAGLDHHVEEVDPRSDPAGLTEEFGPTLVAVALAAATGGEPPRPAVTRTMAEIGYDPVPLDEGLEELVRWLRDLGRID